MGRRTWISIAILLIPILAVIDYATGFEVNFFVFYFAPISLLAWHGGRGAGLGAALASAIVWYVVDSTGGHSYTNVLLGVWNACIRLTAFVVLALALARIRRDQEQKDMLNRRLAETVSELEHSLARITALRNDIQIICAWTKRIKSEGRWMQFEEYLAQHFQLRISHGISEEGVAQLRAEMQKPDDHSGSA